MLKGGGGGGDLREKKMGRGGGGERGYPWGRISVVPGA